MWVWSVIKIGLQYILPSIFGAADERDKERASGEKLGQEETENANAKTGLREVQAAIKAGQDARDTAARNPDSLRDPDGPAARRYADRPD